jgi:hypothetical protein
MNQNSFGDSKAKFNHSLEKHQQKQKYRQQLHEQLDIHGNRQFDINLPHDACLNLFECLRRIRLKLKVVIDGDIEVEYIHDLATEFTDF